jgi:hypothetical protein
MRWYHYLAYFFGGVFLANALPHLGNGISGHAFQSPFATPPGVGLSSSTVNVLWGAVQPCCRLRAGVPGGEFRPAQDTACARSRGWLHADVTKYRALFRTVPWRVVRSRFPRLDSDGYFFSRHPATKAATAATSHSMRHI